MKIKFFFIGILALAIYSCSSYDAVLKSTDGNLKFRKAMEYYQAEDYVRAGNLFDLIVNVFKGTTKSDTVCWYQAQSYYKQKDYILGGHYFKTFAQQFPYSPFAEESEYLAGYCYYLESPKPSLDQDNTTMAIETFGSFINKFPNSIHVSEAKSLIVELKDKLVEKSKNSAILYYDMGYYKSSIVALSGSLVEYPNTKYREELMWRLLDSNYKLAINSIPDKQKDRFQVTIDEYYSFISEFPKSQFKKDADHIYQVSVKYTTN